MTAVTPVESARPHITVAQNATNPANSKALRESAPRRSHEEKWSRGDSNPRAESKNTGESDDNELRAAPCAAQSAIGPQSDPELKLIIERWVSLSEAVKVGIIAIVKAFH